MEEIVKHINDTNASYRNPNAGDAKNTDLFLDNEHFELFKNEGEHVRMRFSKENLSKAILFIASILPRKYDNSSVHKTIGYSADFVYEQLDILDGYFNENGAPVSQKIQTWNARKDVRKKNGDIDSRFYFNGLIDEFSYKNSNGKIVSSKFTIRNYLAGGYSDLHIKKAEDGIFDIWITNTQEAFYNDKEDGLEELYDNVIINKSHQIIYYGAPGTGKSHTANNVAEQYATVRTTFHPDSDYSTFVGAYKPTMTEVDLKVVPVVFNKGISLENESSYKEKRISYKFVKQAFLKAYIGAWNNFRDTCKEGLDLAPQFLLIEEINRGNCAQIFGDLFQLLDRKNGFSEYPIDADEDIVKALLDDNPEDGLSFGESGLKLSTEQKAYIDSFYDKPGKPKRNIAEKICKGQILCLPSNLYIWATMNTSDQSLFPIDSAFKRRWDWEYVPIENAGKDHFIEVGNKHYDWWNFISTINARIEKLNSSEDKKLGYWFARPIGDSKAISEEQFVGKVLFYLWNDVYKDYADSEESIFRTKEGKAPFTSFFGEGSTERLQAFMEQNDILPIEGEISDNEIEEEIGEEKPTSELRAWQQSFWTETKSAYADAGLNVTFTPSKKNFYQLSIGITDMSLINWANRTSGECKVGIYIEAKHGDIYYPKLLAIKNVIEEEIGFDITWKHDQGRNATIFVKKNYNLSTDDDCKAAIAWLVEKGKRIYNVFRSHIDVLK